MFEGTEQEIAGDEPQDDLRGSRGVLTWTVVGLGIWIVIGVFCWLF